MSGPCFACRRRTERPLIARISLTGNGDFQPVRLLSPMGRVCTSWEASTISRRDISKRVEITNSQAASVFWQFLPLLALLALAGCVTSPTEGPGLSQPTKTSAPNTNTSTNSQVVLYDEWPSDGFSSDAARITGTALDNDILTIKISYQGGCQEHAFELHAWTAFLASQPPQGVLHLSHDSHSDTCTEDVETSLAFDLTPLNMERNDPSEFPLLLRLYEPIGGAFATEPVTPLVEWP